MTNKFVALFLVACFVLVGLMVGFVVTKVYTQINNKPTPIVKKEEASMALLEACRKHFGDTAKHCVIPR